MSSLVAIAYPDVGTATMVCDRLFGMRAGEHVAAHIGGDALLTRSNTDHGV